MSQGPRYNHYLTLFKTHPLRDSEKLYSMAEKKKTTETEKKTTVSDIRMWVVCGSGGRNIGTYPIIGVVAQNGAVWACLPL